jgi:hypothetical protein
MRAQPGEVRLRPGLARIVHREPGDRDRAPALLTGGAVQAPQVLVVGIVDRAHPFETWTDLRLEQPQRVSITFSLVLAWPSNWLTRALYWAAYWLECGSE